MSNRTSGLNDFVGEKNLEFVLDVSIAIQKRRTILVRDLQGPVLCWIGWRLRNHKNARICVTYIRKLCKLDQGSELIVLDEFRPNKLSSQSRQNIHLHIFDLDHLIDSWVVGLDAFIGVVKGNVVPDVDGGLHGGQG